MFIPSTNITTILMEETRLKMVSILGMWQGKSCQLEGMETAVTLRAVARVLLLQGHPIVRELWMSSLHYTLVYSHGRME